jgi:hypothetical protein
MTTRKAAPQVSQRPAPPQREQCTPTLCDRLAGDERCVYTDDRRDRCDCSFDSRTPFRLACTTSHALMRPAVVDATSVQRVVTKAPQLQSQNRTATRGKEFESDDMALTDATSEPFGFTFEPCAAAAFVREITAHESPDAVTGNCATLRVHAPTRVGR